MDSSPYSVQGRRSTCRRVWGDEAGTDAGLRDHLRWEGGETRRVLLLWMRVHRPHQVQPIKLTRAELDLFGDFLTDLNQAHLLLFRKVDEPALDRQILGLRVSAAAFLRAARFRHGFLHHRLTRLGIDLLLEHSEELALCLVEPLILAAVQTSDEISQPVLRSIRTKMGDLRVFPAARQLVTRFCFYFVFFFSRFCFFFTNFYL